MGLIVHDISTPDSGLGDALRTGFSNQNLMNAELYNTAVFKVAGYDLSKNDFTDILLAKLNNLDINGEQNVKSDWNDLDPTSDAYILNKPIFTSNEIDVSAIWTTGLSFNVIANAFPINGITYPANPATVTLPAADGALDRIDLIVAIKPVSPLTVGEVGFIAGTPATTALVVPPDFDPSIYYVIKNIIVRAGATVPENTSTTEIYNEGTEWTFTLSLNISQTTNDPSVGVNCLEAVNNGIEDNILFTVPAGGTLPTAGIDLITFDLKLKEALSGKTIFIEIYLGTYRILKYGFVSGQNGYDETNLSYQTISISKSDLNITLQDYDKIRIRPFFDSLGYFIDNVVLHTGSGSETIPETGIPDAPADGNLYGRKDNSWEVAASFLDSNTGRILVSDGTRFQSVPMSGGATIASDGTVTVITSAASAVFATAKVNEVGGISKGKVVYISGATGGVAEVSLADNTNFTKSDVLAIATETKTDGQTIVVTVLGLLLNIDTISFTEGDVLYLGTLGNLTNIQPSGVNAVQRIGHAVKINASTGSILIDLVPLTITTNFNGIARHQIVNQSNGANASVANTLINDLRHRASLSLTSSGYTAIAGVAESLFMYNEGYNKTIFAVDGNHGYEWWTDVSDSHNLSAVKKMSLSAGGLLNLIGLTASQILITDASKNIVSAPVATYPSLAELAFIKGLTSNAQTQLNNKAAKFGTRVTDAAVTGTYVIDHNAGNDFKLTMTGATVFSENNLPTGTNTLEFTIKLTGNFAPTYPAYWDVLGDTYDGTVWNFIAVQIHKGDATQEATAFISNF